MNLCLSKVLDWYAELRLTPELYPILRHTQFEDLLTHNFEDPIEAILKAVQPEDDIESRALGMAEK